MPHQDLLLYGVHGAFWTSFGVTRRLLRGSGEAPAPTTPERTAPWSRALLAFHMVAFGVMYAGIGGAVIPERVPELFVGQRIVGTLVITIGAGFACWALAHFKSWRYRAALAEEHQLATGGPFGIVRHPIYLALDLLALGSALWVPTPMLWAGCVLMVIGSDLRGRAEEKLLLVGFGDQYRDYMTRTKRFIPGIY